MDKLPYYVGEEVRLSCTFRDEEGNPTNPTTVTFKVIDGDGVETVYDSPVEERTGVWYQVITLTCSGTWRYRCEGTGVLVAVSQKSFGVAPDPY